jgi:hypothetical protein
MLEPDADQVEANLHVAVELGQRLLRRNQALLEEQVTTRRALAEKDHAIQELQARLLQAQQRSGVVSGERDALDRLAQAKLDAERQRDINLERILELQRTVEAMKKAAANSREKEMVQSLNQRLEHLVTLLQKKDEEIERVGNQRSKLECRVDSLLLKIETLEQQVKKDSLNMPLRRKSYAPEEDPDSMRQQENEDRDDRLRRELMLARSLREEAEQALRAERAAVETKDVIINALQQSLEELKRKVEEQEIEIARIVGKDVSFAQLVKGNMSHIEAPVIVPPRSMYVGDLSEATLMEELIVYKSRYACREGADQEFVMRWKKLTGVLDSARLLNVEKDLLARGEKATLDELRRIAEARIATAEDEVNLLRLSPSLQVLPYASVVFEHMIRHLAIVKALHASMFELKKAPPKESSFSFFKAKQ